MNALATSLSLTPTALPATSMPAAANEPAREHDFARCLDRARDSGRPRSEDTPSRACEQSTAGAKSHGARDEANAKPRAGASAARAAEATETAEATDATVPVDPMSPHIDDVSAALAVGETADDSVAADSPATDLSALLPGWVPASAAPVAASAAAGAAAVVSATIADDAGGADGVAALSAAVDAKSALPQPRPAPAAANAAPATPAAAAPLASADRSAHAMALSRDDAATTTTSPPGQQAMVGARKALPGETQPALPITASAVAAAAASPMATPALKATEALPPTATAALHAPIDSPGFAPALATQVRWWTQGGVQQAQLTLNPAEMGPVTVRIVLDGREARIDFSADMPATRGAIEAALPVLAATLDDSGLKLTGGGVHDGAAGRQRDWHANPVTHRTGEGLARHEDAARGGGPAARSDAGRGLVDLVA